MKPVGGQCRVTWQQPCTHKFAPVNPMKLTPRVTCGACLQWFQIKCSSGRPRPCSYITEENGSFPEVGMRPRDTLREDAKANSRRRWTSSGLAVPEYGSNLSFLFDFQRNVHGQKSLPAGQASAVIVCVWVRSVLLANTVV